MNCPQCGKQIADAGMPCECGQIQPPPGRLPGLWLFVLIVLTGIIALCTIWIGVPVDESTVNTMVAQAKDLINKHSYAEAVNELLQAEKLRPKRADIHHWLAKAMIENEQPNEALLQLEKACRLAPNDYDIQEMYAEGLENYENPAVALKQFDMVMRNFPRKPAPLQHAAELCEEVGNQDQALTLWRAAIALDPTDEVPHIRLSQIIDEKGHHEEALKLLDGGLKSAPESADLYFHKGIILANLNRVKEATEALNKTIQLEPAYSKEAGPILENLASARPGSFYLIPLKETSEGPIVQAQVNEKVMVNLILDSEASITILSESVASKLQLDVSTMPAKRFTSVRGIDRAPITQLDMTVGSAPGKGVETAFHTMTHSGSRSTTDGLLGRTFLDQFKFTVDRERGQLILVPR